MTELIVPLSAPEAADAARFGPKAANLAALGHAGLPIPPGFCVDADAYRRQIAALGLQATARAAFAAEGPAARQHALAMKLGLLDRPIAPAIFEPLLAAWRSLMISPHAPGVVRSSALVEDRFGASFAGQFESYLGLDSEADFQTAVRACWAALWSTRALRYMATHDLDPADTAMPVLLQPLVQAIAAGGGLSRTADGEMLVNAAWGLGTAIAQGEVSPDRVVFDRDGRVLAIEVGRQEHRAGCVHVHGAARTPESVPSAAKPCLNESQAAELGRLLRRAEDVMGMPVEIEWALDDAGIKLLQARPLQVGATVAPDDVWLKHPQIHGNPAGIGWGTGRACVVTCECELERIGAGDILVTRIATPALSHVLPLVGGVVAERGGSTSHLASLARERGIPMVLGVFDATRRIPDGATVAVDGVAGVVRWMR
jgi:pyruvate, water dikinase